MNTFQQETIDLHEQKLELNFEAGLNLLAGENGTRKTTILEELLKKKGEKRVYGFSPQRNTLAQELKEAVKKIDTNQKTKESFQKELQGISKILPVGFVEYPSFSELFGIQTKNIYDSFTSHQTKKEAYDQITSEFNGIISMIFPNIQIVVVEGVGQEDIKVKKNDNEFPISRLSTGEREVISMITNLEYLKDSFDVFLIDEPEIHLNWLLEKKLFDYLNGFSTKYSKQVIVATHSRIVFDKKYVAKTSFISEVDSALIVQKKPDDHLVSALAGEAVTYIDSFLLDWKSAKVKAFFVEDETQAMVVEVLHAGCNVIVCEGKPKVVAMIKLLNGMTSDDGAKYCGIVDSDNCGSESIPHLITLSRCSIENYFLDSNVLSRVLNRTAEVINAEVKAFLGTSQSKQGVFKEIAQQGHCDYYLNYFPDAKGLIGKICGFDWVNDKEKKRRFINSYVKENRTIFHEIADSMR